MHTVRRAPEPEKIEAATATMQVLVAVIDKLLNGRMTTIMAVPAQLVKMVRCEMSNVIAPQQHATLCMIQGQLVMLVSCTRSSVPSHPSLTGSPHAHHPPCWQLARDNVKIVLREYSFVLMHCEGVWLLTATGVSAVIITDQSGVPLAVGGEKALRRLGVEAISTRLGCALTRICRDPRWQVLTDDDEAWAEAVCLGTLEAPRQFASSSQAPSIESRVPSKRQKVQALTAVLDTSGGGG